MNILVNTFLKGEKPEYLIQAIKNEIFEGYCSCEDDLSKFNDAVGYKNFNAVGTVKLPSYIPSITLEVGNSSTKEYAKDKHISNTQTTLQEKILSELRHGNMDYRELSLNLNHNKIEMCATKDIDLVALSKKFPISTLSESEFNLLFNIHYVNYLLGIWERDRLMTIGSNLFKTCLGRDTASNRIVFSVESNFILKSLRSRIGLSASFDASIFSRENVNNKVQFWVDAFQSVHPSIRQGFLAERYNFFTMQEFRYSYSKNVNELMLFTILFLMNKYPDNLKESYTLPKFIFLKRGL